MTSRVLVLHTGGTIGMREGPRGFAPSRGALAETIRKTSQLHDAEHARQTMPDEPNVYVTPPFRKGVRVVYELLEYEPLLDSANLELVHWSRFAEDIGRMHERYAGFVVLHGTDTMAFTASALSFMLEGLQKPVVLTGSQIPIALLRNDGLDNFLGALGFAALYPIPEVMLYFHHKLLRGNRSSKYDASSLDAFDSPNMPPLATVGIDVELTPGVALAPDMRPFRARTELSPHVASLRIYPGITAQILANFLRSPLEGLVLETYGAGNGPERPDILEVLRAAVARGVFILNVTQCPRGEVRADYQVGRALSEAGVIPGGDLTAEAAMAKLAVLIGQQKVEPMSHEVLRAMLIHPMRGEMSES